MPSVRNKPRVLSAATLSGYLVRTGDNEDLGAVEELMIDPETGRVQYAVLSIGSLFGFGGKLHAVPWDILRLDSDRRAFVLHADRETLEAAPAFDEDNWPDFGDADWKHRIDSHYGLLPQRNAA